MNWSITGIGRPEVLARLAAERFAEIADLAAGEAELKDGAAALAAKALAASEAPGAKIECSGSRLHLAIVISPLPKAPARDWCEKRQGVKNS